MWALSRPIRTRFDNREEREASAPLVCPSVGGPGGAGRRVRGGVCIQVKYTNQMSRGLTRPGAGKCMTSRSGRTSREAVRGQGEGATQKGALIGLASSRVEPLSVSGSDQAREGRLVDALAARGDEGRDTLR